MSMMPHAGLGLRAFKGGALAVAISLEADAPRLLFSTTLATCTEGDRLSFAPYATAFDMARTASRAEAAAAVAEGRRRQDHLAAKSLKDIIGKLDAGGYSLHTAGLLVNRAGWITDLLDYSLGWPDHVPVAEHLAVRDALRFAVQACGLALVELDEKSLVGRAAQAMSLSEADIEARLKAVGSGVKPWRKEQKLACLSAWVSGRLGERYGAIVF